MVDALGGRKFLMVLVMLAVAAVVEVYGDEGLTVNMAGLIMGLYTAFSAANVVTTVKSMGQQSSATTQEVVEPPTPQPEPVIAQPTAAPTSNSGQVEQAMAHLIERQAAQEQASQVTQQSLAQIQKTLVALISR